MTYYPVQNKSFVVLGLARTGLAAVQWLLTEKACVYVFDKDLQKQQQALSMGAREGRIEEMDWSTIAAIVHSPGISPNHPVSKAALAHNIPLITDCNLLRRAYPTAKFIGVTGTNGKSTTTTLIGHILRELGMKVAIGGNVGVPALSLPSDYDYYVLELSSYQLELSDPLSLDVIAWLNISEDHLERHGSMENYVKAKQKIFATTKDHGHVIIGVDDSWSESVCQKLLEFAPDIVTLVSCQGTLSRGIYLEEGSLVDKRNSRAKKILSTTTLDTLRGHHNAQNVAFAYGVCVSLGFDGEKISQAIKTFPGLAHRQELVATMDGVCFINDSKATNADAAAKALATYDDIYWIVGGQDKSDGIDPLAPYFSKIRHAFLIGASMDRFYETLKDRVPVTRCQDLPTAVGQAYEEACKELGSLKVVLLSPACASFDQFQDFEHRGDVFRAEVKKLEGKKC